MHLGSRAQVEGAGRDCSSGGKKMKITKVKVYLSFGAVQVAQMRSRGKMNQGSEWDLG